MRTGGIIVAYLAMLSWGAHPCSKAQTLIQKELLQQVRLPSQGHPFAFDADGDGLDEIGFSEKGKVAFVRNLGEGRFAADPDIISIPSHVSLRIEHAADMDGDGDEDLVAIQDVVRSHHVWIIQNNPGHFRAFRSTEEFLPGPAHFRWGNLDGDRDIDMVSIQLPNRYQEEGRIHIHRNDGANHFEPHQELPGDADAFVLIDIDYDFGDREDDERRLDIVTFDRLPLGHADPHDLGIDDDNKAAYWRLQEARPSVYLNDGQARFEERRLTTPVVARTMWHSIHGVGPQRLVEQVGHTIYAHFFRHGLPLSQWEFVSYTHAQPLDEKLGFPHTPRRSQYNVDSICDYLRHLWLWNFGEPQISQRAQMTNGPPPSKLPFLLVSICDHLRHLWL